MGLGSTAKKLQKVADMAEELYTRINDLRDQMAQMRETVTETQRRVERLETEVAEQRALVQALAEQQGIDVESVTAEAHIRQAERDADGDETGGGDTRADEATEAGPDDGGDSPTADESV